MYLKPDMFAEELGNVMVSKMLGFTTIGNRNRRLITMTIPGKHLRRPNNLGHNLQLQENATQAQSNKPADSGTTQALSFKM